MNNTEYQLFRFQLQLKPFVIPNEARSNYLVLPNLAPNNSMQIGV